MKVRFSHEGGWSGGQWQFDGMSLSNFKKVFGFDPFPRKGTMGEIIGPAGQYPVICHERTRTVNGVDHDHGHQYPWKYEEPMFLFGNCPFPIPVSEIWNSGYTLLLGVS